MKVINGIKIFETYEEFKEEFPNASFTDYLDYRLMGYIGR